VQIALVQADVASVAQAVQQALPEEYAADLSALDQADADLQAADEAIAGAEGDARMVFTRVQQAISGVGAASLGVAGIGVLAALGRVRVQLAACAASVAGVVRTRRARTRAHVRSQCDRRGA